MDKEYANEKINAAQIVALLGLPVQLSEKLSSFVTKPADEEPGERFHPIIPVDRGQGDANVIQCPDGILTLFDFGSNNDDADRFWVGPEMQDFFADKAGLIRNIIVSHQHWDHYRLLPDTFPASSTLTGLENIYISCTAADMAQTMVDWVNAINGTHLLREFNAGGKCGPIGPSCGTIDVCPNDPEITLQVMAANLGQHCTDGGNKNIDSIVVKLTWGSISVLLPGDFEDETSDWGEEGPQKLMVDYYGSQLDVTITELCHHGSSYSSNKPVWRDAVRPEVLFASGDPWFQYQHPRCDVFDSYITYVGTVCKPLAAPTDPLYCGENLLPDPQPGETLQDTYTCGFNNETFTTRTGNEYAFYTTVPDETRINLIDISTDGTNFGVRYVDQSGL
ncbi:hypothetical protein LSH36_41g13101 [Paralvinella palmiformis]|uniref:Metallo-beta-lactamase domain-containing protein n=1 Tax=Paralvinella palmiformis TaxID=53620 RepID=A0AAD9K8W5_9ANNE|nr:hypothetical protein LSH36_41g13101 [Paralvinella palmiformis]